MARSNNPHTSAGSEVIAQAALNVLRPLEQWSHKCHQASLAIVRAGVGTRVARGACAKVTGQHSWVVVGDDCYDNAATIIDPTLWSYDESVNGIWVGTYESGRHTPHGTGSIWSYGKPMPGKGPIVILTPKTPLSRTASAFLGLIGPLDRAGWMALANSPIGGWPAAEILAAIDDTMPAVVPIDILGMVTDRNPGGLYR